MSILSSSLYASTEPSAETTAIMRVRAHDTVIITATQDSQTVAKAAVEKKKTATKPVIIQSAASVSTAPPTVQTSDDQHDGYISPTARFREGITPVAVASPHLTARPIQPTRRF
ncbi:MAG TPA: hypothetical protein VEW28_00115 [Candidatus Kapabacteria bacterium]|nr:hypothetical protein [Candidatus Kapabacteria bacterium]